MAFNQMTYPQQRPYPQQPGGYSYAQPQQTYGPGGTPYGQKMDLFKNNPYVNQYAGLIGKLGGYSDPLMKRNIGRDPLSTIMGDPSRFRSFFGFSNGQVRPEDTEPWMRYTRGKTDELMQQGVDRLYNANIASSRGGLGAYGPNAGRGAMVGQSLQGLGSSFADRFAQAVEWERQNNLMANQTADAMASLYGNLYNTDMNAGLGLLNQELQATKYGADDAMQYLGMMQNAYNQDIDWTNQQIKDRPNEEWQRRLRGWQTSDRAQQRAQQQNQQNILNSSVYGGPYSSTAGIGSNWLNYIQKYNQAQGMGGTGMQSYGAGSRGRMGTPVTDPNGPWFGGMGALTGKERDYQSYLDGRGF